MHIQESFDSENGYHYIHERKSFPINSSGAIGWSSLYSRIFKGVKTEITETLFVNASKSKFNTNLKTNYDL